MAEEAKIECVWLYEVAGFKFEASPDDSTSLRCKELPAVRLQHLQSGWKAEAEVVQNDCVFIDVMGISPTHALCKLRCALQRLECGAGDLASDLNPLQGLMENKSG